MLLTLCFYLTFLIFLCLAINKIGTKRPLNGWYTADINSYQLLVPHRVNFDGDIESFFLPQFFQHDYQARRKKRDSSHPDIVCYTLHFNGKDHQIMLWPNHGFIAPQTVAEYHFPGSEMTVKARKLKRVNPALCHYVGTIKGVEGSKAALSLCDGLAGYMKTTDGTFFIEPVEDFGANEMGHHLHVIYDQPKSSTPADDSTDWGSERGRRRAREASNCGTHNWRSGWEKAFRQYFSTLQHNEEPEEPVAQRRARRGGRAHRYLEVLVVADKMFLDFHKDKDYENYVLTVMNMVSDYYHDESVGSLLDVTVVRIVYLDQKVPALDLSVTPEADKTLELFCKWQDEINPKDVDHPQHHDIAVLITRHDLCTDSDGTPNCGLLGLAYLATACAPASACAINEDRGLILGVVVAHEIGHLMGCGHDTEEISGCPAKEDETFYHVMSPYVSIATSVWSSCSRTYIAELFANNLGNCLMDEPPESSYKFDEMTPGSMYDANYQCNLLFPGSTHCETDPEKFCEKLFCRVEPKKCISNGEPPAEGTKCGAEKWCMRQKCVPLGERPDGIDGGWCAWGDFGPCSRSCGGGIKISERSCTNPAPRNGGAYCAGEAKRFKVCNARPCLDDAKSFRAVQCAQYNTISRNGRFHRWKPYFPITTEGGGDVSCVLYCINEEHTYSKLSPRAKDGTPCKRGTNDMCVSGQCRRVGCDWILDSVALNDKCGICGGNNQGCRKIAGAYTTGGKGYTKVVTFPKGARNIIVRERGPSDNTIAICSASDDTNFYLNGENQEEIDGEKHLGQDLGLYLHPEPNLEELFIAGPLRRPLVLYIVFYEPSNVGVNFEYFIRDKNYKPPRNLEKAAESPEDHHWEFVEWGACSARCGGGEKKSEPTCVSSCGGGIVSDDFCPKSERPEPKTKVCNRQACKVRWHTGEWGLCTGCEHQAGFQVRQVWCARQSPRWEETDVITTEVDCVTADGPKPKTRQLCVAPCSSNCRRKTHSSARKRSPPNMDTHFFKEYYQEVDLLALEPEGLLFGKLKGWTRNSPNSPKECAEQVFIDKPQKCQVDKTPSMNCSEPNPSVILHIPPLGKNECGNKTESKKCVAVASKFLNLPRVEQSNRPEPITIFLAPKNCPSSFVRKLKQCDHRASRETAATKQCRPVVVDKVDRKSLVLVEAPYVPPNHNLSDEAYEKFGDKDSGTIDLQHEKVLKGNAAVCPTQEKNHKNTGFSTDQPFEEDVTEKEPSD